MPFEIAEAFDAVGGESMRKPEEHTNYWARVLEGRIGQPLKYWET